MSNVLARLSSAIDDRRHERDVAIKVLHPELAAALGAERFLVLNWSAALDSTR